jgi:hypothetical protein
MKTPLDNGVLYQRRGCTEVTYELFGRDDGHTVRDATHL